MHKRPRPLSPPRASDRERWDGPPRRRFASPPTWDRDRDREGPPPPRNIDRDGEEEKPVIIPPVISWLVGQFPASAVFDGELVSW
jgi:cleavage stimulation factor subunit 3